MRRKLIIYSIKIHMGISKMVLQGSFKAWDCHVFLWDTASDYRIHEGRKEQISG